MLQFGILLILVLMPLQMLCGAQMPRGGMPELVQNLMLAAPNTHFVMLSQAVLLRGAGLDVVWPQLAMLAAIGGTVRLFAQALSRLPR